MRRGLLGLVATALLAVAPAPADAGRSDGRLLLDPDDKSAGGITFSVETGVAGRSSDCLGFVRIELRNDTRDPRVVTAAQEMATEPQSASVRLAPGEVAVVHLPVRGDGRWLQLHVTASGFADGEGHGVHFPSHLFSGVWSVAGVSADGAADPAALAALSRLATASGGQSLRTFAPVAAGSLPDRWPLLSSADLVLVHGDALRGAPAAQRALVAYVAAGGDLLVHHREALDAGPVRELLDEVASRPATDPRGRHHGFGRVASVSGAWVHDAAAEAAVAETFVGSGVPGASRILPTHASRRLEVPGVGRVPARGFFAGIVLFAAIVGALVFFLGRKGRRRTALVVGIPILGVLFTGGILGFGLLSEGLGTRGALHTVTLLDQRRHEAVTKASRTLYAGIAPSELRVSSDTLLSRSRVTDDDPYGGGWGYRRRGARLANARWTWTPSGVVVDGAALPSRTLTGFGTVTVARARERLRFRRAGDGYDVLADPGFAPVDGFGSVFLRTADGAYFLRGADGRLAPVSADEASRPLRLALLAARAMRPLEGESVEDESSRPTAAGEGADPSVPLGLLGAGALPRGAYVAIVRAAPAFDTLGLDVEWLAASHVVVGLLAPEDVDG